MNFIKHWGMVSVVLAGLTLFGIVVPLAVFSVIYAVNTYHVPVWVWVSLFYIGVSLAVAAASYKSKGR